MSSRTGITAGTQAAGKLTFRGGSVSDVLVANWVFEFANDKLSKITITFDIRQGGNTKGDFVQQNFGQLERLLESEYGKPKQGKLRADADPNFDAFHWQFTDALNPKALRTIELYHGWTPRTHGSSHLEIVYDAAATAGQISLSPVKSGGNSGL